MNCPVCDEKLREVEKLGVTVDICTGCKGIWLDRGELEKIIQLVDGDKTEAAPEVDRSQNNASRPPQAEYRKHDDDDDDHKYDERKRSENYDQPHSRDQKRRKGGILGDIMGMFGGDD